MMWEQGRTGDGETNTTCLDKKGKGWMNRNGGEQKNEVLTFFIWVNTYRNHAIITTIPRTEREQSAGIIMASFSFQV